MVASEQEWSVQLLTRLVEFEVSRRVVELLVLDDVRLGVAQVSEDVVVEVEATFVDTLTLLALAAHADDGLELAQFVHFEFAELQSIRSCRKCTFAVLK